MGKESREDLERRLEEIRRSLKSPEARASSFETLAKAMERELEWRRRERRAAERIAREHGW